MRGVGEGRGGGYVGGTLLGSIAKLGFKFAFVKDDGKEAANGSGV